MADELDNEETTFTKWEKKERLAEFNYQHAKQRPLQIASCVAIPTFIGAWIYCTANYGFLFGFGLGWLPSAILAALVGLVTIFLFAD